MNEDNEEGFRKAVLQAIQDFVSGSMPALPDFVDYLDKRRDEILGMYFKECIEKEIQDVIFDEGKAYDRAEGRADGIVKMALQFGQEKPFIIKSLVTEMNVTPQKAKEYYNMFFAISDIISPVYLHPNAFNVHKGVFT